MNKKQENKLSMYYAVKKVIADNTITINSVSAFVSAYNGYIGKLDELGKTVATQSKKTKGIAVLKKEKRQIMSEKALVAAAAVKAYASDNELSDLAGEVSVSPSELEKLADTIVKEYCQNVYELANGLSTQLTGYGLSSSEILELKNAISDYTVAIPRPRNASNQRSAATQKIVSLIKSIDKVLVEKLDSLMLNFKSSKADFYASYLKARLIVDSGKRYEPDKENGNGNPTS